MWYARGAIQLYIFIYFRTLQNTGVPNTETWNWTPGLHAQPMVSFTSLAGHTVLSLNQLILTHLGGTREAEFYCNVTMAQHVTIILI